MVKLIIKIGEYESPQHFRKKMRKLDLTNIEDIHLLGERLRREVPLFILTGIKDIKKIEDGIYEIGSIEFQETDL